MTDHMQIIEVNGIKMEVDLRHATRIENFKVGDPVKVLSNGSGSSEVHAGVIVGFEAFETLPTIVVAYIDPSYYSGGLKIAHINEKSRDKYELVACVDHGSLMALDRGSIESRMLQEIDKKKAEIADMESKLAYFRDRFGVYFGQTQKA